jgi:hypothetical membrane protein
MSVRTKSRIRLSAIHTESRTVQIAVAAAVVGEIVALVVFQKGSVLLFGPWSIGIVAAIVGAVTGAAGFLDSYLRVLGPIPAQSQDRLRIWRRLLDTSALAVNHVAIWLMLSLSTFLLLQNAFRGLKVDTLSAAMLVAGTVAVATYFMQASGHSIDAFRVSSLLSIFIVSGTLASMITAPDPSWWKRGLSDLGTMHGFSGFAFNFTLIATGGLVITLADYVTADVRRWAKTRPDYSGRNVSIVGWGIVAEGISLAAVGVFPVNKFHLLHNTIAIALVIIFLALVLSLPYLLVGFSATFFLLGYAFIAAILIATLLHFPIGYYSLTALELVSSTVILGWIAVFIRNSAALNRDVQEPTGHASSTTSSLR